MANSVQITHLELQDTRYVELGLITEESNFIFGIKPLTMRPYEYFDDVHIAITFEFDLNLYKIDRDPYSLLDWLGDVGGFQSAVILLLGMIFSLFNYHTFEDHMVTQLYRAETALDKISAKSEITDKNESMIY